VTIRQQIVLRVHVQVHDSPSTDAACRVTSLRCGSRRP
jgi:hypothetical protein